MFKKIIQIILGVLVLSLISTVPTAIFMDDYSSTKGFLKGFVIDFIIYFIGWLIRIVYDLSEHHHKSE